MFSTLFINFTLVYKRSKILLLGFKKQKHFDILAFTSDKVLVFYFM
jgi:hypothetical protein